MNSTVTPSFMASGASQSKAKRIGDREKTAARLLRSSIERSYDGEVDIDWDEPLVPGKKFSTEHRLTLYGTRIWDKLSPEQRVELSRHEMATMFTFSIFVEGVLSSMLLRIIAKGHLTDDTTRYMLTEIGDESRHSVTFSRGVNKLGVEPTRLPRKLRSLIMSFVNVAPFGAWMFGWTLLFEEVIDRLQREAMADEEMQPHLRQLMKIHVLEEARHITFAREELVRVYQCASRFKRAVNRWVIAGTTFFATPLLFSPAIYRHALGLSRVRGFLAAELGPRYRENAQFLYEPMIRFFHEAELTKGDWFTRAIWRMTRAVPDDIYEEIFGRPRKERKPSLLGRGVRKLVGA